MNDYRCPLASLMPQKMDVEQVKRDGWREQKILVVALSDDRLGWAEQEMVRQLGEKLYGRKNTHAAK